MASMFGRGKNKDLIEEIRSILQGRELTERIGKRVMNECEKYRDNPEQYGACVLDVTLEELEREKRR